MNSTDFVRAVIEIARQHDYRIETNRDGLTQIDFGNKKLHADHIRRMFPAILEDGANISDLIEKVAAGRPCTHNPMREIIVELKRLTGAKNVA